MTEAILSDVCAKIKKLTSKPETFLEVHEKKAITFREVLKSLYDCLKGEEDTWKPQEALPELIVEDFDEEQIWQEIALQNDGLNDGIVKDVAVILSKKDRLGFDLDAEVDEEEDEVEDNKEMEEEEDEGEEEDEDFENSEDENPIQKNYTSEIDDDFFKLSEMENFCDLVEKQNPKTSEIDLFADEDSNEERELYRYNDFFAPSKRKERKEKKTVSFLQEQFSGDEEMSQEGKEEENVEPKSSFEERQRRLKAKIESLEEDALKEKPWFLKGEVTSNHRPQNSLLQEYVDFDRAVRPAPVFTEKTTLRLEDIIKQRIKDKVWDDVVRKIKPVEDIREFRKKLVLDQEKSKISLAEIYEQEYIKQRDAITSDNLAPKEDVEPAAHTEIKIMIKKLFTKLDALSNFHYTPKPVEPEIKIISNIPAIEMEDVAPVSTSDAALLAPEEVKDKPKGELMNKEERTTTDKKRERRKKKMRQRLREKKALAKVGLGNKYGKEKVKRELEKVTKEKNVDKMVEALPKAIKSSSVFFGKLQEVEGSGPKKRVLKKVSAKKIKL